MKRGFKKQPLTEEEKKVIEEKKEEKIRDSRIQIDKGVLTKLFDH